MSSPHTPSQSPQDLRESSADCVDSIVFGPVYSRRFGRSLGIDLSPAKKQCNFDCVYCELHKAAPMDSQEQVILPEQVIAAIESALKRLDNKGQGRDRNSGIDVLTFTATGEPTLYPHLYEVIAHIAPLLRTHYPHIRSLILSNGSLLLAQKPALLLFDIVKFSIDAAIPQAFKRIDRPSTALHLPEILHGIKAFAQEYASKSRNGKLIAEILLVSGHNDSPQNLEAIASFLRELPNLARVDLGSIDRPSAYPVRALNDEQIAECARYFTDLPFSLPKRQNPAPNQAEPYSSSPESSGLDSGEKSRAIAKLLKLLATRPLACDEAESICKDTCGDMGLTMLQELLAQGRIAIKSQGTHQFYTITPQNLP